MKTGIEFDTKAVFAEEFALALAKEAGKSGFPVEDWFYSGRQKPENSVAWWMENGGEVTQRYIDWYESHDDVKVWITPDGKPAIELMLTVNFGDHPVTMGIDQVLQMGSALVVVDLKTSAKAPNSYRQLGIYACGIELAYGIRPRYGAYFLPRDDSMRLFQRPVDLNAHQYSVPYFTRELAMFKQGKAAGLFLANPGNGCSRCGVAHACLANGGAKARELDPAHPGFREARS